MNRAIKFRGKRLDNGEWVYGDLEYQPCNRIARIHTYNPDGTYNGQYIVDPDTVGQFTGNYDKNGDEIFNDDILVSKCSGVAVGYLEVFWSDDKAAFLAEDYNDDAQTTGNLYYLSEFDTKDYTICGNTHDSPDLLKEE